MRTRTSSLLVTVALVAAACGTDQGGDTTVPAEDSGATTSVPQEVTTTALGTDDAVHAEETGLGSILVDPDGFTLYVFDVDAEGESSCYDACATTWPPVSADTAISPDLEASIFGTSTRTDGSEQLTVNGMPLYRYAPDFAAGDTNGQGFNGVWWVVDGDGNEVTATSSSADSIAIDYGY